MTPQVIDQIFSIFHQNIPSPKGELYYTNPFTLLVAVALSAQATDKGVNKATKPLFEKVEKPQDILDMGYDVLEDHIKSIGLYRSKAKNIMALCQRLIEYYEGKVPQTREDLETLPGVGRKTANVVLNIAFGQKTIAVDTHLFRVSRRIGLSQGKTPLAVEKDLVSCIPDKWLYHAHHWLILHGRYTCKARAPQCHVCPIVHLCEYDEKIQ